MYSESQYRPPNVNTLLACGTTANIWRHPTRSKVVIKAPVACYWESSESGELQEKFSNEIQILEILGEHRNIVRYLGLLDPSKPARDLLFEEAGNGDLQQYINNYGDMIDDKQKLQWCENAAEDEDLNIRICDFGGSKCGELDGGGLPDFGFFDPRDEDIFSVSESTEVFGLGSIMYSIMTGHRPHGPSIFRSSESIVAYGAKFEELFRRGILPETEGIVAGEIILDCWEKKTSTAKGILERLQSLKMSQTSPI